MLMQQVALLMPLLHLRLQAALAWAQLLPALMLLQLWVIYQQQALVTRQLRRQRLTRLWSSPAMAALQSLRRCEITATDSSLAPLGPLPRRHPLLWLERKPKNLHSRRGRGALRLAVVAAAMVVEVAAGQGVRAAASSPTRLQWRYTNTTPALLLEVTAAPAPGRSSSLQQACGARTARTV